MRKLEYTSKDFNKSETSKYKLALQLGKFEYGYTIYNVALKKFVFVKFNAIPEDKTTDIDRLSYVFENESLLKLNYDKTAFIYCSLKATLVPDILFSEDTKSKFLEYNHFIESDEIVLSNKIENSDIVNVFSFPQKAKTILAENLTNYKIYHQYTSFIESAIVSSIESSEAKEVFINVDDDFFNICVVQSEKLLFNNSFSYQSIDDFAYFVHLTLRNLKLNNVDTSITLSGNISEKVGTYKLLKKYFENLKFKTNFPKAAFSDGLKLDKHYFDNLIYITI